MVFQFRILPDVVRSQIFSVISTFSLPMDWHKLRYDCLYNGKVFHILLEVFSTWTYYSSIVLSFLIICMPTPPFQLVVVDFLCCWSTVVCSRGVKRFFRCYFCCMSVAVLFVLYWFSTCAISCNFFLFWYQRDDYWLIMKWSAPSP